MQCRLKNLSRLLCALLCFLTFLHTEVYAEESYSLPVLTENHQIILAHTKELQILIAPISETTKESLRNIPKDVAFFVSEKRIKLLPAHTNEDVFSFSIEEVTDTGVENDDTLELAKIFEGKSTGDYLCIVSSSISEKVPFFYLNFESALLKESLQPAYAAFIVRKSSEASTELVTTLNLNYGNISYSNDAPYSKLFETFNDVARTVFSYVYTEEQEEVFKEKLAKFKEAIELELSRENNEELLLEIRQVYKNLKSIIVEKDATEIRALLFVLYDYLEALSNKPEVLEERGELTPVLEPSSQQIQQRRRQRRKQQSARKSCQYKKPRIIINSNLSDNGKLHFRIRRNSKKLLHEVRVLRLSPKQPVYRRRFRKITSHSLEGLTPGNYRILARAYDNEGVKGCFARRNIRITVERDDTNEPEDLCPDDPQKINAGICGCGITDKDTDGDGTPDCLDQCVNDAEKSSPLQCGCGESEFDADNDGFPDCIDACPLDETKQASGVCGCGVADTDSDADGSADCQDFCPDDPEKTLSGVCGCGVSDRDSDGDASADCFDACPNNPNKQAPGECGCEEEESACQDNCPLDPQKANPGICGCGTPDTDSDSDGTPDCNDQCPNNAGKIAPGVCDCEQTDIDTDNDGIANCNDQCPSDANKTEPLQCGCGAFETDIDGDGTSDCIDACPNDDTKQAAGICGCGVPDTDSDLDDTFDCQDACPNDETKIAAGLCGCGISDADSDNDGTVDCLDACPDDPEKTEALSCGCGTPETDSDNDGTPDCLDLCPNREICEDNDGDSLPDVEETADSDGDGIPDAFEHNEQDTDADGTLNYLDNDDDGDEIPSNEECPTLPCLDADSDSIPDYLENNLLDTDGDNNPDVADSDDDNDGVLTSEECQNKVPGELCPDSDGDSIPDHVDKNNDFNENSISDTDECSEGYPCPDSDLDFTPDYADFCPEDNNKRRPLQCGCGVAETDTDSDGVPDCIDECVNDNTKHVTGSCGCGISDRDSDGDGSPDCSDACPQDANKTQAGACGCGTSDVDSDGDGVFDCSDQCPSDNQKSTPGICGCGSVDTDSDGDGLADCLDSCAQDSQKTVPGVCGCGTPDTDSDSDGTLDCQDGCPQDANKTAAGVCGCGTEDVDSDSDGSLDCQDACPNDAQKTAVGVCGCGVADTDTDADGIPDCNDQCPQDAAKTTPGECGCGVEDVQNAEGEYVCVDLCPDDDNKTDPGVCGCGEEELDGNNDGIIDCGVDQTSDASFNDSVFKREAVYTAEVELAKEMEKAFGSQAALFNMEAAEHVLQAGTEISLLVDQQCFLQEGVSDYFATYLPDSTTLPANEILSQTLALEIYETTIGTDITLESLRQHIADDSCVQGITDGANVNSGKFTDENFNDPQYNQQDYLKKINFDKAASYFNTHGKDRVVVATIDSGFDIENNDGVIFAEILAGSNFVELVKPEGEPVDAPQDTYGHGTEVASIIAAAQNNSDRTVGIAAEQVQLLPIRVFRNEDDPIVATDIFYAIRHAVNAGANIINISLSGASEMFCDPIIGEAIYLGIEKGVFFVFSAGNGYPDANGVAYPIDLKGPTDDGPQDFGRTMTPACWGEYFKGAVTVAASDTATGALSEFSNYGQVVEMIAPGEGITTNGLDESIVSKSGTSFSAPQVTAAAALIMSVAKTNNWFISPWLLEDMLLNGSPVNEVLSQVINDGKYLDLEVLKDYVELLRQMTPEERRRIPSKNQRVDDGWDPEGDIENVDRIHVTAEQSIIDVGENVQLKAYIVYKNGDREEITEHEKIFWTAQYQPSGLTTIGSKTGLFRLLNEIPEESRQNGVRVIAHFGDYDGTITLENTPRADDVLEGITVKQFNGRLVDGEFSWKENIYLKVFARYRNLSGDYELEVTQESSLLSDNPNELEVVDGVPGLLRTVNTYGGKTYQLTVSYLSKTITLPIKIRRKEMVLEVHNALGNPYQGQTLRLRSVLETVSGDERLPVHGNWHSLSEGLQVTEQGASEILIATELLPIGTYQVEVSAPFRGLGDTEILSTTYEFTVESSFDRLSLVTHTPVINYQQRAVFSLRFFSSNNSYTVIDPARVTWSTSDPALPIDNQGIVYPTIDSLANGSAKTYTIYANYQGRQVSAVIQVSSLNTYLGQQAALTHLSIELDNGTYKREVVCVSDDKGNCLKYRLSSVLNTMMIDIYAHYTDGSKRLVNDFANVFSSHPSKLHVPYSSFVKLKDTSSGGETYKLTVLYDGIQLDRFVEVIPTVDIDLSYFKLGVDEASKTPPGGLILYTEADKRFLPFPLFFTVTDAHGNSVERTIRNVEGTIEGIYSFSDENGPIPDLSNLPYDKEVEQTYSNNRTYYGYNLDVTASVQLKKYREEPTGMILYPDRRKDEVTLRGAEKQYACYIAYPNYRSTKEDCRDFNISLRYGDGDNTQPVTGVGYYYHHGNIRFVVYGKENVNRKIEFDIEHKDNPSLRTSENLAERVPGIEEFLEHPYVKEEIPVYNAVLKTNDPFCTDERKALSPFAGGSNTLEDPYLICTEEQFLNIDANAHYVKLLSNLDFNSFDNLRPIHTGGLTLEGNHYTISNYTIIDRELRAVGIFKHIKEARNLTLVNPTMRGYYLVGVLAAATRRDSIIENIVIKNGAVWGTSLVGGLVAATRKPSSSQSRGTFNKILIENTQIKVEEGKAGCLFAEAIGAFKNIQCSATIEGAGSAIGGLIGDIDGSIHLNGDQIEYEHSDNSYLFNVSFEGQINVAARSIGGLIGSGTAPIIDSNSSAQITTTNSWAIGGLYGATIDPDRPCSPFDTVCLIFNSSFTGTIIGGNNAYTSSVIGGLVGKGGGGMIINSSVGPGVIMRGINSPKGLVGSVYAHPYRILNSEVDAEISSSTETLPELLGDTRITEYNFYNEPKTVTLDHILEGNSMTVR